MGMLVGREGAPRGTAQPEPATSAMERELARLRAVVALQRELASSDVERGATLDLVARRALELTGGDGAAVQIVDGDEMVVESAAGMLADHVGARIRRATSLSGICADLGAPLACEDAREDARVDRAACERMDVRSMLLAPLLVDGARLVAVLNVSSRRPRAFDAGDLHLLSLLAGVAGAAIERASHKKAQGTLARGLRDAVAACRESERCFAAAFEQSGIGMGIVSLDGRWLQVNRALCDIVGYDEAALLATDFQSITHPDDLAEDVRLARELRDGAAQRYQLEKRYVRADGRAVWVLLTVAITRDEGGRPLFYLAQVQDIDAKRRHEEELDRARRSAEAATLTKQSFLTNMSHEMRTPLNGVVGMTELLVATPLSQAQREYVEVLRRCSSALLGIVNDVLDLAKVGAGRMELEQRAVDVRTVVAEAVAPLLPAASKKGLDVDLSIDDEVPARVVGDAVRLRQVLTNLVGNAVKFTEVGAVDVEVRRESVDGAPRLRFLVRDTGCGIEEGARERLFQAFSQGDSSTTRRYGGTGLGLSISRSLVELMGGAIDVESAPGLGSTFTFTIPCAPADDDEADAPPRAVPRPGLRVLLAEDNAVNQRIVAKLLGDAGCVVDTVQDGAKALAAALRDRYDCVLMDCQMPEMDGYQATRVLRRLERGRRTPIVALTAHALEGDRDRCLAAGMDDYLTKPITRDALLCAVARATGARDPLADGAPVRSRPS